jgi:hypothetical protein
MQTKLFRSLLTAAVTLLLGAPLLHAKKVEFPEKDPAFTFNMPDSWSTETGKDGRTFCTAPDGFKIGIVASPSVSDPEEAKALLPKILKGMADAMKGKNYEQKEVRAADLDKMWMAAAQAHCSSEGTEMSLNAVVFVLPAGKYYSIVGAAPKKLDEAHEKEMNELLKSIEAFE